MASNEAEEILRRALSAEADLDGVRRERDEARAEVERLKRDALAVADAHRVTSARAAAEYRVMFGRAMTAEAEVERVTAKWAASDLLLRQEIDRLRAGESTEPHDPAAWPTPGQAWHELLSMDEAERTRHLERLIRDAQAASDCFTRGHEMAVAEVERLRGNTAALYTRAHNAEAQVAAVRAVVDVAEMFSRLDRLPGDGAKFLRAVVSDFRRALSSSEPITADETRECKFGCGGFHEGGCPEHVLEERYANAYEAAATEPYGPPAEQRDEDGA